MHSLRGRIKYIDEFRRLHFIPEWTHDEQVDFIASLGAIGKRIPYYTKKPSGIIVLRLNLSKYEKPYMKKYEALVNIPLIVTVSIESYEHHEYGSGISIKLDKYRKRLIPQTQEPLAE